MTATAHPRGAIAPRHTIPFCMINPNENDLTRDEPLPAQRQPREEEIGSSGREQFRRATRKFSTAMSQILGALGIGIAIGLAIRFASTSEQKAEVEVKSPLGDLNWSVLSLPFLWPLFKSAREKYESSADAVADAMKDGVKRLKKIDVDRYAKPIRKRWKAWTR